MFLLSSPLAPIASAYLSEGKRVEKCRLDRGRDMRTTAEIMDWFHW